MDAFEQPHVEKYESTPAFKIVNIKETAKSEAPQSPLLETYDEEKAAKYFQDAVCAWRQGSGAVRIIDESPKPSSRTSTQNDFFASFPFFYGWIVLIITTIARVFKAYGQMNTLFMYIPSVLEEFDFSRAFFSSMFGFACIVGAFLQPLFGGPIDRLGARICMPMSLLGVSASLILFSVSSNFVMIFFALVGLRTICIGVMENVLNQCLSQWFSRLRGRAFSINQFMTLFIVCTMIDQILNLLNERYGWRVTMQIAACSASLYTIPIMLFMRKACLRLSAVHPSACSREFGGMCRNAAPACDPSMTSPCILYWKGAPGGASPAPLFTPKLQMC
ncbi:hypothetical protein CYMTET_19321 [Cymbomonas tetramitiformis]|uniref:Major facilitator superfamily (MFS) profile domain-containing protein n=1 Tax=Cymbomonas tetramitiformis TaxID=36881 RepID=A0AAE0G6B0_9CHLO|nr:hypothetical protein CYMTET_19321 [Cymbomonas tetramitiformis]